MPLKSRNLRILLRVRMMSFCMPQRVRLIWRSSLLSLSGTKQGSLKSPFSSITAKRLASLLSVFTLFTLGSVTRWGGMTMQSIPSSVSLSKRLKPLNPAS